MVMRARPNVTPTLLRLDDEARAMLDEYRAATGTTLGAAGSSMIAMAYRTWAAQRDALESFDDYEPVRYCQGCFGAGTGARCCICGGLRDSGVATAPGGEPPAGSLAGKGYGPLGGAS